MTMQSDSNDEAVVAIARIIARICYEDTSVIRRRETEYQLTVSRDHANHDVWSKPARGTSLVANINRHLSSACITRPEIAAAQLGQLRRFA